MKFKRGNKPEKLSNQMKRQAEEPVKSKPEFNGDMNTVISTGSTLLDLAISGDRIRGGGIPKGILVEISGISGTGKTVMLCEIAGAVQRQGGQVMFHDPEARLNKRFAQLFDLNTDEMEYQTPDTVPKLFEAVRKWEPEPKDKAHCICTDSLAALSTDLEIENSDKYGMRRAKEFSEEARKTCRILTSRGFLMVCSNQVRINIGAGPYAPKYTTPGGQAIGFYASLRLFCKNIQKIPQKQTIAGKEQKRIIGIETTVEVIKNSVSNPFRTAPLTIIFDYGIDDVRQNLKYIKVNTGNTIYSVGETKLGKSLENAIRQVERDSLERRLRKQVINLWEEIESKFAQERKVKKR